MGPLQRMLPITVVTCVVVVFVFGVKSLLQSRYLAPTQVSKDSVPIKFKSPTKNHPAPIYWPSWFEHEVWEQKPFFVKEAVDDFKLFESKKHKFGVCSTHREDEKALRNFFNGMRNGVVFEMGALDGDEKSVSKMFEALLGWKSILIEADPVHAKKIPKNRPNSISIHSPVCFPPRILHYSPSHDLRSVGVLVELANTQFLRRFHSHLLLPGTDKLNAAKVAELEEVPCLSLGFLLDTIGVKHINFFVLDCEGCELEALRSIDFQTVTIDVMVVENEHLGHGTIVELMKTLNDTYETVILERGDKNTWFRRKSFVPSPFIRL